DKLHHLDAQISAVLASKLSHEQREQKLKQLTGEQLTVQAEFSQFQDEKRRTYGVNRGEVYELARIQARLPADTALLAWLDIKGEPKGVDASGKRWACIVRHRGEPVWVKLPGSGPKMTWTKSDDALCDQVRGVYGKLATDPKAMRDLTVRLAKQRFGPLEKVLT